MELLSCFPLRFLVPPEPSRAFDAIRAILVLSFWDYSLPKYHYPYCTVCKVLDIWSHQWRFLYNSLYQFPITVWCERELFRFSKFSSASFLPHLWSACGCLPGTIKHLGGRLLLILVTTEPCVCLEPIKMEAFYFNVLFLDKLKLLGFLFTLQTERYLGWQEACWRLRVLMRMFYVSSVDPAGTL